MNTVTDLKVLIKRGYLISLTYGRLMLISPTNEEVSSEWLRKHSFHLVLQILQMTGKVAYIYDGYSTGAYGASRAGGVTLQFEGVGGAEDAYVVFNANLKSSRRSRHRAAGSPLPVGRFWVGRKSSFSKFWCRAGLPLPPSLTSFHDYMGKLKGIYFEGELSGNPGRLKKESIIPLSISYEELASSIGDVSLTDTTQTNFRYFPDKAQIIEPDKERLEPLSFNGVQRDLTARVKSCVPSNQEGANGRNSIASVHRRLKPEEQTVDEWLEEYGGVD